MGIYISSAEQIRFKEQSFVPAIKNRIIIHRTFAANRVGIRRMLGL